MEDISFLKRAITNPSKPFKIITHGWRSSGSSPTCERLKNAYLTYFDYNVIILDWSLIASNFIYPIPMEYTKKVGKYYAQFLDNLVEIGVNPKDIHLIGHSLGAHVSGFAGKGFTKGKIGRITGKCKYKIIIYLLRLNYNFYK